MNCFRSLKASVRREFFAHPVVAGNPYTGWFKRGPANTEQVIDLIVQFSVFSNYFIVCQAKRMVHAGTLEGERGARHILLNECGVALDPHTGSTEGRGFSTDAAHLNWLREVGRALGLGPMELGRWGSASERTRRFLLTLERTYGSEDWQVGSGASFAIETWAAHGIGMGKKEEAANFWHELIEGLKAYNRRHRLAMGLDPLPLGFFQYHFELEKGHGLNVWRELEEFSRRPDFDLMRFLKGGRVALDALHVFWEGLDHRRRELDKSCDMDRLVSSINISQWAV